MTEEFCGKTDFEMLYSPFFFEDERKVARSGQSASRQSATHIIVIAELYKLAVSL
jgi:hypothetical protein